MVATSPVTVFYVPVRKSLEALLSDHAVLQQCLSTHFADVNILSDFIDGSVYKSCASSGDTQKKFLSLILYQDAFEVANPLGSAKHKYKVMGFYFVLGNLEAHNRSAVDHIQLVMLAMDVDLGKVGQRMFRRLVDDLKASETDGISVNAHQFHVIVPAIARDNLGSHWLGGFVTNFSSVSHMCRYCTVTRVEFTRSVCLQLQAN